MAEIAKRPGPQKQADGSMSNAPTITVICGYCGPKRDPATGFVCGCTDDGSDLFSCEECGRIYDYLGTQHGQRRLVRR